MTIMTKTKWLDVWITQGLEIFSRYRANCSHLVHFVALLIKRLFRTSLYFEDNL